MIETITHFSRKLFLFKYLLSSLCSQIRVSLIPLSLCLYKSAPLKLRVPSRDGLQPLLTGARIEISCSLRQQWREKRHCVFSYEKKEKESRLFATKCHC